MFVWDCLAELLPKWLQLWILLRMHSVFVARFVVSLWRVQMTHAVFLPSGKWRVVVGCAMAFEFVTLVG